MSGSSTKKYAKMLSVASGDGRARGLFWANGARTGRFTSRHIQLQNMFRCSVGPEGLEAARERVKSLSGSVADLKDCVRTALIPAKGSKFVASDFSQIEARLAAFVAGEEWAIKAFEEGRDIYSETASRMFGIPYEKIAPKDAELHGLRQRGKVASLALGYGGSVGALEKMGALEMGIPKKDLPGIVAQWRRANPKIAAVWKMLNSAAKDTVAYGTRHQAGKFAAFRINGSFLQMGLASGRCISYFKPHIREGEYGDEVAYMGISQQTRQACETKLWGGLCFENLIQALARDILIHAMRNLEAWRYSVVATVHDEIICEVDDTQKYTVDMMNTLMCCLPKWAAGLPLTAEGWEGYFYRKE